MIKNFPHKPLTTKKNSEWDNEARKTVQQCLNLGKITLNLKAFMFSNKQDAR